MNEDRDEEDRIKIRDDRRLTNNHTPGEGHNPIGNIVLEGYQDTWKHSTQEHTGLREYLHQPLTNRRLLCTN